MSDSRLVSPFSDITPKQTWFCNMNMARLLWRTLHLVFAGMFDLEVVWSRNWPLLIAYNCLWSALLIVGACCGQVGSAL